MGTQVAESVTPCICVGCLMNCDLISDRSKNSFSSLKHPTVSGIHLYSYSKDTRAPFPQIKVTGV